MVPSIEQCCLLKMYNWLQGTIVDSFTDGKRIFSILPLFVISEPLVVVYGSCYTLPTQNMITLP